MNAPFKPQAGPSRRDVVVASALVGGSLLVGCSLGRGAADALSDIDAALGIDAPRGEAGAGTVEAAEAMVVAALPELGALIDVLRHRTGPADQYVRRIFAQFADGTQLDLAVVAEAEISAMIVDTPETQAIANQNG